MARHLKDSPEDPRYTPIQINLRIPWWMHRPLVTEAKRRKMSLSTLVADAIELGVPDVVGNPPTKGKITEDSE